MVMNITIKRIMKPKSAFRAFLLLTGSLLLAISYAHAAPYYWDIDGATPGSGPNDNPAGNWTTGGTTWSTSSLGDVATPAYTTTIEDDLFFAAGNDATSPTTWAIALTDTQHAKSLTFEDGAFPTIRGNGGNIVLGGTGNITVNAGVNAFIGANTSIIISGSAGLTKLGTGMLSLSGTQTNTFTGGLRLNNGTLDLRYFNMGTPTNLITSQDVDFGGGLLVLQGKNTGASTQTLGNVTVNAGGGSILITPSAGTSTTLTLGSLTASAAGGSLVVGRALAAGAGTVAITTTTNKDATGIYGGRVVFANGTANTGYDWATSTGGPTYTLRAYTDYNTTLPTSGSSSTTNYSIAAGITLSASETVNSLKITGSATALALGANTLTIQSGGLLSVGTTAQTISGAAGVTGLTAGSGGGGSADLVIHQYNSGAATISAVIGDNTAGSGNTVNLVKAGLGSLTLSGANTFTGSTIVNQGLITLSNNLALQNSAVDTAGPGTITLNGTNTPTLGGLIGSKNLASVITAGAGSVTSLTLNPTVAAVTNTYSGVIANLGTGAMDLTKSGAGTQILSGSNTYTGATAVNGGKLLVNGNHTAITGGAGYTVSNADSTLGGTGRLAINGSVSVTSSAILAPGASIGTLTLDGANTTGNVLNMNTGAKFGFELSGTGGTPDQLAFWNYTSDDVTLNANLIDLSLLGTETVGTYNVDIFKFFSDSGTTAATHAFTSGLAIGNLGTNIGSASIDWDGLGTDNRTIALTYTVVPEPHAALLSGIGMLILLRRRR